LDIFTFHKAHVASAEKGINALERFRAYIETRGGKVQCEWWQRDYLNSNTNSSATCKTVSHSEVESVPAGAPGPSIAFDSNSVGHALPDVSELVDPVPIDESWFASQDFYFEDIIQWQ
jgi:hypothetical protein